MIDITTRRSQTNGKLEALEGRRTALQEEMYALSGRLTEHLYAVEREIDGLPSDIHAVVCRDGTSAVEDKAQRVLRLLDASEVAIDPVGITAAARRLVRLKEQIAQLDRDIIRVGLREPVGVSRA